MEENAERERIDKTPHRAVVAAGDGFGDQELEAVGLVSNFTPTQSPSLFFSNKQTKA